MKNFKKYLLAAGLFAMLPMIAHAEVTVKETTSPEFLYNQGYSKEVSRIIEIKSVDPSTPIPEETAKTKWQKAGRYILQNLDPSLDSGQFVRHNIKYSPSLEDL